MLMNRHQSTFYMSIIVYLLLLASIIIFTLDACSSTQHQQKRGNYDDWGVDSSRYPLVQTIHPNVRIEEFNSLDVKSVDGDYLDSIPKIIFSQQPKYPDIAAEAGIEGVVFIAGNIPFKTEIAPLLIMSKLEQFDYEGANAIALVMLAFSFLILFIINSIQVYANKFTKE